MNLKIWKLIENWKLEIENSRQGGYVAISIVLILTAVILGIMITVAQLGIGEGQTSLALSKGEDALNFVEGCTEDALLKIRSNSSYSGGTISRPQGTCSITVVTAGAIYTVTATTEATIYKRTIQTVVNRGLVSVTLTSWKEQ